MSQLIRVEDAEKCCEDSERSRRPIVRKVFQVLWEAYLEARKLKEANPVASLAALARTVTASTSAGEAVFNVTVPLGAAGKIVMPFGFTDKDSFSESPSLDEAMTMLLSAQAEAAKHTKDKTKTCMRNKALPQNSSRKYGTRSGQFRI